MADEDKTHSSVGTLSLIQQFLLGSVQSVAPGGVIPPFYPLSSALIVLCHCVYGFLGLDQLLFPVLSH